MEYKKSRQLKSVMLLTVVIPQQFDNIFISLFDIYPGKFEIFVRAIQSLFITHMMHNHYKIVLLLFLSPQQMFFWTHFK